MANAAALINEGMWRRDRDFRALPRLAQCTYLQLLSQKDLDCAGVLTLHIDLLAKGCAELTIENLWEDFKTLEAARFIFVDADTDELFIRSYVRLVSAKSPNAYKSALKVARMVNSPKIRAQLAAELRRLGRKDAAETADDINPLEPRQNPVGTPSEPVRIPSGGDIPSGTPGISTSSVPVLTSVGGSVGEVPPPRFCDKHPNGTDENCGACGVRRKAHDRWTEQNAQRIADRRAEFWAAVRACPDCDDNGNFDDGHRVYKCPAHEWPAP